LAGLGALGLLGKEILVNVGKNTTLSDRDVPEKSMMLVPEDKQGKYLFNSSSLRMAS
jgi:hypothetical protein